VTFGWIPAHYNQAIIGNIAGRLQDGAKGLWLRQDICAMSQFGSEPVRNPAGLGFDKARLARHRGISGFR
jgi:hypothetical protein